MLLIRSAPVLLLAMTVACYSYRPASVPEPPAGQGVRLMLSDSGTTALAALLGPSTAAVAGVVVTSSPDAYLISVRETRTRSGRDADWAGEQVSIPRSLVSGLEGRYFSRRRTVLAATGLVAALFVARDAFAGAGGVFGGGPPGGNPTPR